MSHQSSWFGYRNDFCKIIKKYTDFDSQRFAIFSKTENQSKNPSAYTFLIVNSGLGAVNSERLNPTKRSESSKTKKGKALGARMGPLWRVVAPR